MKFDEKYISTSAKAAEKGEEIDANKGKVVLSDDAYAIGEMLEQTINKLEHIRLNLILNR